MACLDNAHERAILSVDWAKDGLIATAGADNQLKVFKFEDKKLECVASIQSHQSDVNSVKFNPQDNTQLATCADDNTIKIWRLH